MIMGSTICPLESTPYLCHVSVGGGGGLLPPLLGRYLLEGCVQASQGGARCRLLLLLLLEGMVLELKLNS